MDHNNHSDQFSASLPLPDDDKKASPPDDNKQSEAAAELIRKKVQAAYSEEPDVEEESEDIEDLGKKLERSKHQDFILELTSSGRLLHEIQTAWHEYYAGLTDNDKHQVWQEFYAAHSQAAQHPVLSHNEIEIAKIKPKSVRPAMAKIKPKIKQVKEYRAPIKPRQSTPAKAKPSRAKSHHPLHSLLFGIGTGCIVILIFMFSFFNERIIAPFIQPSRTSTNIPIINNAPVSQAPEAIIPKINVEIPVVYDVNTVSEDAIQAGLQRGAVHYADTAMPGQNGNVVIVGHSSGNIFNSGDYKFAFSLLRAIDNGDTFFLQKDGKRYTYQVYDKKVVKPTDVGVLGLTDKPATATLITCDPPGTSSSRLVIVGQQISPDPVANNPVAAQPQKIAAAAVIPGNSPTLWSRLTKWFAQ